MKNMGVALFKFGGSLLVFLLFFMVDDLRAAIEIKSTESWIESEKTVSGQAYSAVMWVKVDAKAPRGCLVAIGEKQLEPTALGVWVEPEAKRFAFWNGKFKRSGKNLFPLNKWFHFVVTGSTTQANSIYVNGKLVWEAPKQFSALNSIVRLGRYLEDTDPLKSVSYDQVSIWSRPLSESEIKANYNTGKGRAFNGSEGGLIVYWKCDTTSGGVRDSQLNGTICKGVVSGRAGTDYKWVKGVDVGKPLDCVDAVTNFKLKTVSDSSIKVSWDKVTAASGYKVVLADNDTLKSPMFDSIISGNSKLFNKLKPGRTYYISVKTERDGEFSSPVTGQKSTFERPQVTGANNYYHYRWKGSRRFQIVSVSSSGGFKGLNFSNSGLSQTDSHFTDYAQPYAVGVRPGGSFTLNVELKDNTSAYVGGRVWIDWNCDGDFNDQDEKITDLGKLGKQNPSKAYKLKIKAPKSAVQGVSRMRIRILDSGSPDSYRVDPQGVYDFPGTAHDYRVQIGNGTLPQVKEPVKVIAEKEIVHAPKIRCGHILKACPLNARKVRWMKQNGTYIYREPESGMKFVQMFVKVKKGFSISVADYLLYDAQDKFKGLSIAEELQGTEFKAFCELGFAKKKDRIFRILYEVNAKSDVFNVEFALDTSISQPSVEGLSFTQTKQMALD